MVKTEHNHSISSWNNTTHQSQSDYYMNMSSNSYGNAGLLISDTNSTTEKTSSSPTTDFNSPTLPNHKEIYPWMNDKKHGSKKSKSNAKNLNTTSTSSTSSSSGKHFFSNFHPKTISRDSTLNFIGSHWIIKKISRINDFVINIAMKNNKNCL